MLEISVKRIPWPFPQLVHAVALWPFIIYEHEVRYDEGVQAHERYHWHDQMKWLVLPWFIIYVALLPFYGGFRRHPFEKSAYAKQDEVNANKNKKKNKENS